ncbi:MAG: adenylate/guanylate cyclase domain-containing protein [Deltaproteobacteria bacterium]|nr:adenylate/guanylate cyclase domain-containing protein [Deltaproteobacteria bacterium]
MYKSENEKSSSRDIAVLFTDIVNSTDYFKKYGDTKGRKMLKLHVEIASPCIYAFGGFLLKTVGDSIMAYFNDPKDALKAAILIQQKFEKFRLENPEEGIHLRIGIHYGKTIIEEKDIFGDVVNIASRLTDLSDVDGILISENVFFHVKNIPNVHFKEFLEPKGIEILKDTPIYRVVWEKDARFEPEKRICIFLNLIRPLDANGTLLVLEKLSPEISKNTEILSEDTLLLVPKSEVTLIQSVEKVRFAVVFQCMKHDIKGLYPFRMVVDVLPQKDISLRQQKSVIPWHRIDPGGVFISSSAIDSVSEPLFVDRESRIEVNGKVFYLKMKIFDEENVPTFDSDFRKLLNAGERNPCFYCGDRRHKPSNCPSKKMLDFTTRIEEIGYLSLEEIEKAFFKYVLCDSKTIEEMDSAKEADSSDLLKKVHQGFYEAKRVFQLRFLRSILDKRNQEWELLKKTRETDPKGGILWLALDSIRVGDYKKVSELLNRAEDEKKDLFAIFCLKGFYQIELDHEEEAKSNFYLALREAKTQSEKIYVLLLLSRLNFVCGDIKKASEFLKQIFNLYYECLEARYFDMILRLYSSRLYEKEKEAYIKKIIRIAEIHREYYIYTLFDADLTPFSKSIKDELKALALKEKKEAEELLVQAEKLYNSSTHFLLEKEAKDISSTLHLGKEMVAKGGYFGFLDAKDMFRRAHERMREIREQRIVEWETEKKSLKKKLTSLKAFIDSYPYMYFLRKVKTEMSQILRKLSELEKVNSFALWKEKKTEIEAQAAELEKKLKKAEDIMYGIKLVERFLKVCTFFLIIISLLTFLVFPLFSGHFHKIVRYDFVQFQKTFFVGGLIFSLIISFYSAVRNTNK